jgi:hypothetical protein
MNKIELYTLRTFMVFTSVVLLIWAFSASDRQYTKTQYCVDIQESNDQKQQKGDISVHTVVIVSRKIACEALNKMPNMKV